MMAAASRTAISRATTVTERVGKSGFELSRARSEAVPSLRGRPSSPSANRSLTVAALILGFSHTFSEAATSSIGKRRFNRSHARAITGRSADRNATGSVVRPSSARSANAEPTTGANLKPWPLKPAAMKTLV